jgi:hypothetical protein
LEFPLYSHYLCTIVKLCRDILEELGVKVAPRYTGFYQGEWQRKALLKSHQWQQKGIRGLDKNSLLQGEVTLGISMEYFSRIFIIVSLRLLP